MSKLVRVEDGKLVVYNDNATIKDGVAGTELCGKYEIDYASLAHLLTKENEYSIEFSNFNRGQFFVYNKNADERFAKIAEQLDKEIKKSQDLKAKIESLERNNRIQRDESRKLEEKIEKLEKELKSKWF